MQSIYAKKNASIFVLIAIAVLSGFCASRSVTLAQAPVPWTNLNAGNTSPAFHASSVTPNDSTDLTVASRALYVGTTGDVVVIMAGGQTVTFKNVPAGVLSVMATRVKSTGTTASNIVALW